MAAIYDSERLLDDVFNLIKNNLNTKIAEIQAEKDTLLGADNFTLPIIDDNAYFDQLDERVTNYNCFVYYGIGADGFIVSEGATANDTRIFFTVVLHNSHSDQKIYKKMLRYIRALKEIVDVNFDKFSMSSGLAVESITPADIQALDSSEPHKIGGIIINTQIY